MPSPIEEIITDLANSDQPLLNSKLTELSNLCSEELECLKHSWASIETKRRRQIIYRLAELAEDNLELNFDSILKYCLKDEDDKVRGKAIDGLWENEEASLIDPLINLLKQDSSENVRAAAATALGKFAMLAECQKLSSSHLLKLQEALLTITSDNSQPMEIKRRTLEAVAPLSLPEVKTAITQAYQSPSSKLKISSIYAMGKNCDHCWLPILLKELASTDNEIRFEAAGACGELEEEAAVPHLVRLVDDPDTDVQMAAIQALGKTGGTAAKECLEYCLNNPNEAIHQAAEQALLELETKDDALSFWPGNA